MTMNATGGLVGGNLVTSRLGTTTANLSGVAATAAKTYTTQAMAYSNQGKLYYVAGASGATTPTTDVVTGAAFKAIQKNQGCVYVWTVNAAGVIGLAQGPIPVSPTSVSLQTNVDDSGNWSLLPQFPALPDNVTPVAYSVVRLASTYAGTGFIPGISDNWNATGVTTTQQDLFGLPASPQLT